MTNGSSPESLAGGMPPGPEFRERTRGPFRRMAYVLAVTSFGAGLPTPLYATYQQQFGFSSTVLAEVFATYTLGVLLTMFLLAPQIDLVGTRPVLYVGMVLTALSGVVFIFSTNAPMLAAARLVSGLAVGATTSTATVAMNHREPRADQHHVARVAVGANFGGVACGIFLGGVSVALLPDPRHEVFLFLIAASLLGILAIRISPPHPHPERGRGARIERVSVPRGIRGPFWVAVGGLMACYAIYGFFASLAPTAVEHAMRVSGSLAAVFVAVMFASAALVQMFLGKLRDRNALLLGLPLLAASLVLFVLALPFASIPLMLLAGTLMGIGVGCVYMGSVTLVDRVTPESMGGEVLSGFYVAGYLALAVPTLGLGLVADSLGVVASGSIFGLALGAFVILTYFATRRTPLPPGGEGRPLPTSWGAT